DEMIRLGISSKTGRSMGHMSMSGEQGSIAALRDLSIGRRILFTSTTRNPALLNDSSERRTANSAGWEIAYHGTEVLWAEGSFVLTTSKRVLAPLARGPPTPVIRFIV